MSDLEKQFENFVRPLKFDDNPDIQHRDKLEQNLLKELEKQQLQQKNLWRIIMKSQKTKFAAAAVIILAVVLMTFVLDRTTAPLWAIEQSIEVLKDFRAIHIVVISPDSTTEIWARSDEAGIQSTDMVARLNYGAVIWVKDGSTYYYEPKQNTVYFEPAVTLGVSPWFGPLFIERLSKTPGAKIIYSKDPITGRDHATLISNINDVHGVQSFAVEFDVETKLPVSIKQWHNMDWSGPPDYYAPKLTYYKELDDSLFDVQIPGNPVYVEKPLTIPEENIDLLSNPDDGISSEGLTQQQACEQILRDTFTAVIEGDAAALKKLSPLSKNWPDELIRSVIFRAGQNDQIVEIVNIGQIFKMGHTKIGPIAAVPVVIKRRNGTKYEEKMIVQFRQIGGKPSCVVHGPYGLSREIK